jgi:hypothetical protein
MKTTVCDLCNKNNTAHGNQEIWSEIKYPARSGMCRVLRTIDICLHCLNKIEDYIDVIKRENQII